MRGLVRSKANATTFILALPVVTIRAVDSSGVAALFYSLDPESQRMTFTPYTGPIELDASATPAVSAYADDKLGNRGGDSYRILTPE